MKERESRKAFTRKEYHAPVTVIVDGLVTTDVVSTSGGFEKGTLWNSAWDKNWDSMGGE